MVANASRVFNDPPVVVGHRGMGRGVVDGHAENTLESFLAAADVAPWVEVDVCRTADDALVVYHDPALEDGRPIASVAGDEAVAAGLPRLTDLLDALPERTGVNLEIKSALEDAVRPPSRTTAALAAPVVADAAPRRPVLVSSFDPAALQVIGTAVRGVRRGLITWINFPVGIAVAAAAGLGMDVLSVHVGSLHSEIASHPSVEHIVRVAHDAGLEVLAWCPEAAQGMRLASAGVDALCVNDPRETLAALAGTG